MNWPKSILAAIIKHGKHREAEAPFVLQSGGWEREIQGLGTSGLRGTCFGLTDGCFWPCLSGRVWGKQQGVSGVSYEGADPR